MCRLVVALAAVASSAALAPMTPHGLVLRDMSAATQKFHADVVRAAAATHAARLSPLGSAKSGELLDAEASACRQRLSHLRALVREEKFAEAIDASFALHEHFRDVEPGQRRPAHPDCIADAVHVGEGTIATKVLTPADRVVNPAAVPVHTSFIRLHPDGGADDTASTSSPILPIRLGTSRRDGKSPRVPMSSGNARVPVVGFSLDGHFVLADAKIRCRAARSGLDGLLCDGGAELRNAFAASADEAQANLEPRVGSGRRLSLTFMGMPKQPSSRQRGGPALAMSGLFDAETSYAVGAKTVIVIPVLPSDGLESDVAPKGYNYGLVASAHGGSIEAYIDAVMVTTNAFYERNSFAGSSNPSKMSLVSTVTQVYNVNYLSASCGSVKPLEFWGDQSVTAIDMMAFAAASAYSPTEAFDFQVVFMPKCTGLGFSGLGWVGLPGTLQHLYAADDYDASVAHELGHNLGASHASYMTSGSRGAVAWEDDPDSWVEYGNPHTTMGQGSLATTDFLVEGKSVFDWIGPSEFVEITPFDELGIGQCNPCGPYEIHPTDAGSFTAGNKLGVQLSTDTSNRCVIAASRNARFLFSYRFILFNLSRAVLYSLCSRVNKLLFAATRAFADTTLSSTAHRGARG